ncbi:MAG: TonB-dependent receptor [Gammaproteobacteria bacterium]|nr:MAG: TonB-dependent receptor [Gammaproteobacteria bacterium]
MKVYFYALMAMSLITTQINADEPATDSAENADEIVVTSSILNPSRILNPLYVIDGDEIEDNATTSLGEAVDSYLGVSIADYGAAVGQPIIRGMSGPRVKVLKNGLVNRDVSGLGADHLNDIDLNDLQQVEIIKGPSSLLYANGTSGGIINVVDNCIAPEDFTTQEFIAGLETQSVNDGDSQFFNYKNNLNGFNVNVGYKKSEFGNFDIPNDAIMHDEDHEGHDEHEGEEELSYLENSDLEIESTKFGISRAGEWGHIGISVDNHESMYGIPYHGEHSDEEGHDDHDEHEGEDDHEGDDDHHDEHEGEDDHDEHEGERIFSTTDQESFTIKGLYNVNGSLINSVTYNYRDTDYSLIEAHAEEEGHDEHEGEEHEEHAPTVFSNDATEYGAIFDLSNDNFIQKISLNFVDEDSSIVGEEAFMNPANNEEFTIGYFVSADLDMFYLDAGFRLDQIDRTGSVTDEDHGDIDNYSIDDTTNSFALNLGRDLSDTLDVNFGFASVERLPSVIELFMNGPHMATGRLETGNPNLQSETSNNFDITFNYESGDFFAYASFYVNDVDNYITLQDELDGHDDHDDDDHGDEHGDDDHDDDHGDEHGDDDHDDHAEHANLIHADYVQEDAEFRGYEFEFGRTFRLGSGDLRLSFGRDDVNAEFSDGHNVPRINPARNIYSLSYVENDWVFKLSLKDVEKQDDIGEGESVTDSYQMLNTRLTKTYNLNGAGELKVSIFGSNLLDEVARNHSSFVKKQVPLAGRNYGAKFSYKF